MGSHFRALLSAVIFHFFIFFNFYNINTERKREREQKRISEGWRLIWPFISFIHSFLFLSFDLTTNRAETIENKKRKKEKVTIILSRNHIPFGVIFQLGIFNLHIDTQAHSNNTVGGRSSVKRPGLALYSVQQQQLCLSFLPPTFAFCLSVVATAVSALEFLLSVKFF